MMQGRNIPEPPKPVLESRHHPSGLNSKFSGDSLDFADYVISCRDMLHQAHAGMASCDAEIIVAGNAPFELEPGGDSPAGRTKPYRRGILLVHGLTDSPYLMRPLAESFRRRGFRVLAVLLPGHGTQPGDLLDIRWQEWARTVAWGVEQLAKEADEVYLAGYSAGATLAIRHSLLDARVRGLFLFSPALRVSSRAAHANLHKIYSWLMPSAKWVSIQPDMDSFKYESFPKNAAFQMHALIADMHAQLRARAVDIPVFAAASADDATVDSSATVEFMARAHHACSKLVYYTTDTAHLLSCIPESRVELVSSVVPEQNIVSFSHLSILLPPEDRHYGVAGEYSNCLHYYPDDLEKYTACGRNAPPVLQGEVTEGNLRAGVMRRLAYNPHFAALEASMQKFIESLP
jgi:esterase/lipase